MNENFELGISSAVSLTASSLSLSTISTIKSRASGYTSTTVDTDEGDYLQGISSTQGKALAAESEGDSDVVCTGTTVDQKLGRFSFVCLLVDKKIGTGVYSTAPFILKHAGSPGAALLTYLLGWVIQGVGLCMYLECAMAIPRYVFHEAGEIFVRALPRSGGDKNYLEHIYRAPKYLTTCIYAAGFVVFGSTAGNAIVAAQHLLILSDCDPDRFKQLKSYEWKVKGIATAIITIVCVFHSAWRTGGIYLNNTLAVIKLSALVFVICAGLWWHSTHPNERPDNFSIAKAFARTDYAKNRSAMQSAGDFAYALVFSFYSSSGFEATNNILSEVRNLHLRPKYVSTVLTVYGVLSFIFTMCFVSFFLVLDSKELAEHSTTVVSAYINKIFSGERQKDIILSGCDACSAGLSTPQRVMSFLLALSAFGNIVIVTYINSRVKQEIAKEGVLPASKHLAKEFHSTPVYSLMLHWFFSVITIIAVPDPLDGYSLLVFWYIFMRYIIFGCALAVGMVYIYSNAQKAQEWVRYETFRIRGARIFYGLYALSMFALLILSLLPTKRDVPNDDEYDSGERKRPLGPLDIDPDLCPSFEGSVPWGVYPFVPLATIAAGVVYWFGFAKVLPRIIHRELDVKRTTVVDLDEGVQIEEYITFRWVIPERFRSSRV